MLEKIVCVEDAVATVMVNGFVALCAPAVTCAVKLRVPVAVGVPVMTPVAFSAKPPGRATGDQV